MSFKCGTLVQPVSVFGAVSFRLALIRTRCTVKMLPIHSMETVVSSASLAGAFCQPAWQTVMKATVASKTPATDHPNTCCPHFIIKMIDSCPSPSPHYQSPKNSLNTRSPRGESVGNAQRELELLSKLFELAIKTCSRTSVFPGLLGNSRVSLVRIPYLDFAMFYRGRCLFHFVNRGLNWSV